ncbi:MAG: 16S rRNA (cytidine(1402)-2'-O)-methyltransferase [Clostridia bacterium]|nr:16S rRNA (cytidine(1402)-2'-O)-methyltransferase [Oscillospiraceae bacterium]MBQ7959668.1 16S rRNA (cytidine(1402)-2'-O)-methyltransferase [Clostridia bacterium]
MSGILYLCPTPIGNLQDITFRTLETLKSVELIAAEDTRNTLKLLNYFDIDVPLTSYYEHNKAHKGEILIEKLKAGQNIALVSDAGMPAISDPGEDLVRLCIDEGIEVVPLPGASAFSCALVASGMPTGRFSFEGFLTMNKRNRKIHLEEVKNDTRTLIFYEAPHKLLSTLKDMLDIFGNREIVLARELTKKFEEFFRTTISEAIVHYEETPPKGEFVLIIKGKNPTELEEEIRAGQASPEELLERYGTENLRGKELVNKVAEELGLPKREVYDLYLKTKNKQGTGKEC